MEVAVQHSPVHILQLITPYLYFHECLYTCIKIGAVVISKLVGGNTRGVDCQLHEGALLSKYYYIVHCTTYRNSLNLKTQMTSVQ